MSTLAFVTSAPEVLVKAEMTKVRMLIVIAGILLAPHAAAGPLDALGFGKPESGRIAKYSFTLHETFDPTSVVWSPDARYIATAATFDGVIHIWDVQSQKIVATLPGYGNAWFHTVAWSPDGRFLATCAFGKLVVYEVGSKFAVKQFPAADQGECMRPVAFSPNGDRVAIASDLKSVSVVSTSNWKIIQRIDLKRTWGPSVPAIDDLTYLPRSGDLLIAGSRYDYPTVMGPAGANASAMLWLLHPGNEQAYRGVLAYDPTCVRGGAATVRRVAVSPGGEYIATATDTGGGAGACRVTQSVHVFRVGDWALVAKPLDGIPSGIAFGLTFTHSGRFLVAGMQARPGTIQIIETHTFQVSDTIHTKDFVYDIASAPNSDRFAVATGREIEFWSIETPKQQ